MYKNISFVLEFMNNEQCYVQAFSPFKDTYLISYIAEPVRFDLYVVVFILAGEDNKTDI